MKYKVYASVCETGDYRTAALHNYPRIGSNIEANTLKEAMQVFYDSEYCLKYIDKNIHFYTIHFYYERTDGKICYYHGWIDL